MFRDISTLLSDPDGLNECISQMSEMFKDLDVDYIAGIESRGFIVGSAMAFNLNKGFIMIRKQGKLPGKVIAEQYDLEYGKDTIEIQYDAFPVGSKILLVDDLIATGGTVRAAIKLIERLGGIIGQIGFIIDLPDLGGSKQLKERGYRCSSILEFDGH